MMKKELVLFSVRTDGSKVVTHAIRTDPNPDPTDLLNRMHKFRPTSGRKITFTFNSTQLNRELQMQVSDTSMSASL